jgi:hypothetical protein
MSIQKGESMATEIRNSKQAWSVLIVSTLAYTGT